MEEQAYLNALKEEPEEETLGISYYEQLGKACKAKCVSPLRRGLLYLALLTCFPPPCRGAVDDILRDFVQYTPATISPEPVLTNSKRKPQSIESKLRNAQDKHEAATKILEAIEEKLGVAQRWTVESDEYKKAQVLYNRRRYQCCVDELEGLVVARLFELTKVNMAQTGECTLQSMPAPATPFCLLQCLPSLLRSRRV